MYHGINSSDVTGTLITQLKVIKDDVAFLDRVGQEPDMEDYPFVTKVANAALIDGLGNLQIPEVERVERTGFIVCLLKNGLYFHSHNNFSFRVPLTDKPKLKTMEDWREVLGVVDV